MLGSPQVGGQGGQVAMRSGAVTPERREMKAGLNGWLSRGAGALLRRREMQIASHLISNLFGYQLILIGPPAYIPMIARSRVLQTSVIVPPSCDGIGPCEVAPASDGFTEYPFLSAHADALPLASDSVDVLLLPHVLEFSRDAHAALREAERTLVGEGHLVLIGFNPLGPMGLWRACLRHRNTSPWTGEFFSLSRMKEWLAVLGFDIVETHLAFFRPPLENRRLLTQLRFLERVGSYCWPHLGATYVILARKRLTTITPVRARWRRQRRLVSVGVAEPSSRLAEKIRRPDGKSAKSDGRPPASAVRG